MAVVGSAEIIVRAITDKVKTDIQKAFRDARPVVAREGESAGKEYADSFGTSMNRHMTNEARTAARGASNAVREELDRGLDSAGRRGAQNAGRNMEEALTSAGGRGGRGYISEFVNVVQGDFTNALNRLFTMSSLFDVFAPAIANLVGAVSSVISALFAMGSAASYAAGSIAVLPGLLGAAAQAFGAVKLGFGGVGEALKQGAKLPAAGAAVARASNTARKSTVLNAAAIRAQQKAQDELTAAQKAARRAQDALTAAQDRAKAGAEEQAAAERRLAAASQERTRVLSDPNASALQGADVQKSVDDAQKAATAIARSRKDAQDDVLKAAERNDAAQARLAAAEAARNKLRDKAARTSSPRISTPKLPTAPKDPFGDAMAKLTPEARAFVMKVLEIKAAFKAVGDEIGRHMFPKLTQALSVIQNSRFFDILKSELSDTGGIVGELGLQFAKAFTTQTNMTRFQQYLRGNNDILDTLTTTTQDGTTPMTSLVNILLKVGLAVQPLTKRFAEWAASMITAFDAAHSVGDMSKFFNRAGDSAAQLGRIFGNLFDILGSLGKAANPAGQGLLDSFEKATQKLSEFLDTPKQQKVLKEFFEDTADNMRDISDLIVNISGEFLSLGDNKGIGNFADALQPAVDNMGDLGDKLTEGDLGTKMGELATSVTELINAFVQTGQMGTFIDTLTLITKVIAKIVNVVTSFPGAGAFLAFLAVFRAARFASSILGFSKSFDKLRGSIFKLAKAPFAAIGKKIKGAFGRGGGGTSTPTRSAVPDGAADEARAEGSGRSIGESLTDGMAAGIKGGTVKVSNALDHILTSIHTEYVSTARVLGQEIGDSLVDGLVLGIKTNTAKAAAASTELGDDVIDALKKRLGIASPSKVMQDAGDDTADGFVNGIRQNLATAYKAGADLGDAASDGARAASGPVRGAAASNPAALGISAVGGKADDAVKKTGKLSRATGKLGGVFKSLGGGLSGLLGGPLGAFMLALPLIIAGFTALYKSSPEFRKFVDGLVKAIKPVIKIIGQFVSKVLNNLFAWINDHMPQIKAVFSSVFGAIGSVITNVVIPVFRRLVPVIKLWWEGVKLYFKLIRAIWENVLSPVFRGIWRVARSVFGNVSSAVRRTKNTVTSVFNAIRKVWTGVLAPVFRAIKNVAVSSFNRVRSAINTMKNAFSNAKTVIGKAKDGLVTIFNAIKNAAKKPIKWVIDTVWNKGFVSLADKIPGVSAGGWKVSTKGWATGGWTGPGAKYKPAGIVHADEFVVKKASRRAVEKSHPGLLDYLNRMGRLPGAGYASGGRVKPLKNPPQWTTYRGHTGIDFPVPKGTGVYATEKARVAKRASLTTSYGKHYFLKGSSGYTSIYGHLSELIAGAVGSKINKGQLIGKSGSTGNSTGPHLHFEVRPGGTPGAAVAYLKGAGVPKGGKGESSLLKLGGKLIHWGGNIVKGGIKWAADKAKAAYNGGKKVISFIKNLPGRIKNNMSSGFGKLFDGIPKASANKVVSKINSIVPKQLPLFPLKKPFKGIDFRENGGRVRKGSPYVVGEKRPELFIPDSSGTIMPNLSRLTSSNAIADILKAISNSDADGTTPVGGTTHNNSGSRNLTVNVNNPAPERSSKSVAKAVRSRAIAHGWGV